MGHFQAAFEVFSPRWGHTDRYQIVFTPDKLLVSQGNFSATCKHGENGDPEWSGYNAEIGNPLMQLFENDSIYAPAIVPWALAWVWQKWCGGAVSNNDLEPALTEFFSWVDQTARSKPNSKLWQEAF